MALRGVTVILTLTGFRVTSSSSQFSSRDSTQFSDSGSADDVDEFEIQGKHCQSVTKGRSLLTVLFIWSVRLSDPQRSSLLPTVYIVSYCKGWLLLLKSEPH